MSNWRNTTDDTGSKFLTFERDTLTLEETNKNWAVPFNWKVSSSGDEPWSSGFYLGLNSPNTIDQAKYTVEVGLSIADLGVWISDCIKHHKSSHKAEAMKAVIGVQAHRNVEVPPVNEQQFMIAQTSPYAFQKFDMSELD